MATASRDGKVKIWRLSGDFASVSTYWECDEHHPNYVNALSFSPTVGDDSGLLLASGGADRLIHIYNVSEKALYRTLVGHDDNVCSLSYQADGTLLSCSWDNTVRIWREATEIGCLRGHDKAVWCVEPVSPGVYLTGRLWCRHWVTTL